MTLKRDLFDQDIVQTAGHDVPCTIVAPAYGALNATLDNQSLYDTVRKNWVKKNRSKLLDKLLTVCSPNYNTDPTAAVCDVGQGYSD